jgi:hypothetical protein
MGHHLALITLIAAPILAAQEEDPAEVLTRTRDKVLAMVGRNSRYRCTETIERKYFSRANLAEARSCDQIEGERARGRVKLRMERVDRIRFEASVPAGSEVFSWTSVAPRWIRLTDIVESGPISTGSMGPFLEGIFRNPSPRFQLLGRNGSEIEYGFEVALEMSRSLIRGGSTWQPEAYEGKFTIDASRLELRKLSIRAQTVPPESHACAWKADLGFSASAYEDPHLLLPDRNTLRFVQLDGEESENAISFSGCEAYRDVEQPEPVKLSEPLEPGIEFPLVLDVPLDLRTAAAGDRITARVPKAVTTRSVRIPKGAEVEGRILRFQHDLDKHRYLVAVAFETIRIGNEYRPLYATLRVVWMVKFLGLSWPTGTLDLPETMTGSKPFESYWITVKKPQHETPGS